MNIISTLFAHAAAPENIGFYAVGLGLAAGTIANSPRLIFAWKDYQEDQRALAAQIENMKTLPDRQSGLKVFSVRI
jgi:hypothetical protein